MGFIWFSIDRRPKKGLLFSDTKPSQGLPWKSDPQKLFHEQKEDEDSQNLSKSLVIQKRV